MKSTIMRLFLLITIFPLVLFGQTSSEIINFWDNSYLINPASINPKYKSEFIFSRRSQWVGLEGAPQTIYAAASLSSEDYKSQIGMKIVSDKIGYYSLTDCNLAYSYFIRFRNSRLNFGISGILSSLAVDVSKIYVENPIDPIMFMKLNNRLHFDADLGMEYVQEDFRIGLSSNRIFEVFAANDNPNFRNNTNFIYALYRQDKDKIINFGFGLSLINNRFATQAEVNLSTFIRPYSDSNPFQLGISYRTSKQISFQTGVYLGDNIKLLYNYEINYSLFGLQTNGTHELMLRFRIKRDRQWGHRHYFENLEFNY
jgi:type IX secretion system PorP/SprF family membrane protein